MKRKINLLILVYLCFAGTLEINAKNEKGKEPKEASTGLELPEVFADHAVFQRNQPIPIWGTAKPGKKVSVSFAGQKKSTMTDDKGMWRVELKAMKASDQGQELVVVEDKTTLRVKDILIGEVWLCSGQSNMAAKGDIVSWSRTKEIALESSNSLARIYRGVNPRIMEPIDLFNATHRRGTSRGWQIINKGMNIPAYLACALNKELKIPVGMVDISVGGTSIQAWMRPELLTGKLAVSEGVLKKMKLIEESLKKNEAKSVMRYVFGKPTLMNSLCLRPVEGYGVRGVVWYQGESNLNEKNPDIYTDLQQALFDDWRKRWGADLPFHYVQIGTAKRPFVNQVRKYDKQIMYNYPSVTFANAQWRYSQRDKNSAMVTTVDIGDEVHYKAKPDTAARIAMSLLARQYGRDEISWQGPTIRSVTLKNKQIILEFDHADGLHAAKVAMLAENDAKSIVLGKDGVLIKRFSENDSKTLVIREAKDEPVLGFAVLASDNKTWYEVAAVITGEIVTLTIPSEVKPIAVAGGAIFCTSDKKNVFLPNCYNKDALPLVAFYENLTSK